MRKLTIVLVPLAVLAALFAATAHGRAAATFKYCTDPSFPPMELATTSGKITGFDVDMATALGKTWSGQAAAVKTAFPALLPALNAKKCDAVISGTLNPPDRKKQAGVAS